MVIHDVIWGPRASGVVASIHQFRHVSGLFTMLRILGVAAAYLKRVVPFLIHAQWGLNLRVK